MCIKLHIVILMLKTCKQNLSILLCVTTARGSGAELNGIIRIMALFYRTSPNCCSSAEETANIYAAAWQACQQAHALYSAPRISLFIQSTSEIRSGACSSHQLPKHYGNIRLRSEAEKKTQSLINITQISASDFI